MTEQLTLRQQADALLELSNDLLAALIGQHWQEAEALAAAQTKLHRKLAGPLEISEPNRLYLLGVLEHIKVVDALAGQLTDRRAPGGAAPQSPAPGIAENDAPI